MSNVVCNQSSITTHLYANLSLPSMGLLKAFQNAADRTLYFRTIRHYETPQLKPSPKIDKEIMQGLVRHSWKVLSCWTTGLSALRLHSIAAFQTAVSVLFLEPKRRIARCISFLYPATDKYFHIVFKNFSILLLFY